MANTESTPTKYEAYNETSPVVQDIAAAKFNYAQMQAELQIESERWKTKRRMSWVALASMIVATGAMFFLVDQARLSALDSVISWFYMATTTIIGAYIGSSTWEHIANRKPEKPTLASVTSTTTPFDDLDNNTEQN